MHYSRAVDSVDNQDQEYLRRKEVYRPQESKFSRTLYVSKISESKCCIKKEHTKHWLFEGIKNQ